MRTKRIVTFAVLAAVVGGGGFLVTRPSPPKALFVATAGVGSIRSEVAATGTVQPARTVALNFASQGRVGDVAVVAGSVVSAGQVLASLDARAATLDVEARTTALALAVRKHHAVRRSAALDQSATSAQTSQSNVAATANAGLVRSAQAVRDEAKSAADARVTTAETQAASDQTLNDADRVRLTAGQTKLDGYVAKRDEARTALDTAKATWSSALARRDEQRTAWDAARAPLAKLTLARDDARRAVEKAQADLDRSRSMNPDAAANGVFFSDNLVVAARERFNAADRDASAAEPLAADAQRAYELSVAAAAQAESLQATVQSRFDLAEQNVTAQTASVEALTRTLEASTETARRSRDNIETVGRANGADAARDAQSVRQSEAAAEQARAAADVTRRQAALRNSGSRPVEQVAADADVDTARQALRQAEERLAQLEIRAPFDGIISSVGIRAGEQTGAGTQLTGVGTSTTAPTPAFTLIDASTLAVRVGFPDVDLARMVVGQKAAVRFDAVPDALVEGEVIAIEPSPSVVNNVSTTYVRISLPTRPKGIRVGMAAAVRVIVSTTDDAIVVPSAAVTESAGVLQVNRVMATKNDGKIPTKPTTGNTRRELVTVTTGDRSDGRVQIVTGLRAGDVVVVPDAVVAS